jgi:hypothetical protein
MKNTLFTLGAGMILSASVLTNLPKSKIKIYPKTQVYTDTMKLVALDTALNRLDSCYLSSTQEWSFGKLKPGTYHLALVNAKSKNNAIYKNINIENPKLLHKLNLIGPERKPEGNISTHETLDAYDKIPSSAAYKWSFGDEVHSTAVAPSLEKSTMESTGIKTRSKISKVHTKKMMDVEYDKKSESVKTPKFIKTTEEAGHANVLTAGIWNDLDNWDKFEKTHTDAEVKNAETIWGIHLINHRFGVEIKNNKGQKVIGETVSLKDNEGNILWTAITDNRGKAELWNNPFNANISDKKLSFNLSLTINEKVIALGKIKPTGTGYSTYVISETVNTNPDVDVCFVVDATGSMGDEISYLKAELMDVMMKLQKSAPCSPIRLSSVFYKDQGDEYVTRKMPFVNRIDDVVSFVSDQYAGGGGDFPEAVHSGLNIAINELDWSKKALTKVIFLILDAPPHTENAKDIQKLMQQASEKGIKIIPITASGIDKSTEFCMKYLAAGTGGDYIYITDHSGVGNGHIKPTGVVEDVDLLNTQILKTLKKYSQWEGCKNQDSVVNPIEPRIDIFGNDQIQISAFPNPASKYIKVKSNVIAQKMSIYNLGGSLIQEKTEIQSKEVQLDVSSFSDGLYILNVIIDGKSFSNKFFVSKGLQGID